MSYGVVPTGFSRKPLAVILAEIETGNITEFGPDVIQTSQSPLGQINGLVADLVSELWEVAEDVYQSYDPDQAEGARLDMLARIRLLSRALGEGDDLFRTAITNASTSRINLADLSRAIQNVPGVVYRSVTVNETQTLLNNSIPPNTIAIAVIGGEDEALAGAANQYIIPGISTYGANEINVVEDGFCRALYITRPQEVGTTLFVETRASALRGGCPSPSATAIETALLAYLSASDTRPGNGQAITPYMVRSFIESRFPTIEFSRLSGEREDGVLSLPDGSVPFAFAEIASVLSVSVVVY